MENMPKSLQVEMIRDYLLKNEIDSQLIDLESEIDGSLTYPANLEHIKSIIRCLNGEITQEELDLDEKDNLRNRVNELEKRKTPKTKIVKQFILPIDLKPITYDHNVITFGGNIEDYTESLKTPKNILIVGRKGSGKSVVGAFYSDIFQDLKEVWYKGFPLDKQKLLPSWIKHTNVWWDIPKKAFIFVDEGDSQDSAYERNSLLIYMLERSRQKGWTIFYESKNTARLNINIIRDIDILLIKEPSIMQSQFERHFIGKIIGHAQQEFNKLPKEERIKWLYIYSEVFIGMVKIEKPIWFTQEISEAWA